MSQVMPPRNVLAWCLEGPLRLPSLHQLGKAYALSAVLMAELHDCICRCPFVECMLATQCMKSVTCRYFGRHTVQPRSRLNVTQDDLQEWQIHLAMLVDQCHSRMLFMHKFIYADIVLH
jgi:hypothetical protein